MAPREFFNAWIGFDENQKNNWDVAFWISKHNALRTTWSKEQGEQIQKDIAPWEEKKKSKSKEPLSGKKVCSILDMISK